MSRRGLRGEIREGLAWVYRHPMLAPLALPSHGWRWGVGRTVVASRAVMPLAFALVAVAPVGTDGGRWAGWVMAGAGQFLFGLALGTEGPNELGYRQAVTPDRLQGRMNATMRSLNRGMIVVGAPLGGLLGDVAT